MICQPLSTAANAIARHSSMNDDRTGHPKQTTGQNGPPQSITIRRRQGHFDDAPVAASAPVSTAAAATIGANRAIARACALTASVTQHLLLQHWRRVSYKRPEQITPHTTT